MRRFTRSIYHKKVKFINKRKQKFKKQAFATAFINNNSPDFWSEISKTRKKTQNNKCLVEGNTNDKAISLCFSDHYKQLYNYVDFPSCEWKELYSYVSNDIVSDCNYRGSFTVTLDAIINTITHLKPGKSDGFDGLSTDYFINSSPLLSEYLSSLFTCMLSRCFIPTSLSVSTIVPIPKGSNKDLTNIKNYRGIALSSLISKLFDNCIISSNSYIFDSHDLQFAYNKKTTTVQCVSITKEVINYYVNQKIYVYMYMLDASKAFDRVNLLVKKLFKKVIYLTLPGCHIMLT